jgi:hypothetical protein
MDLLLAAYVVQRFALGHRRRVSAAATPLRPLLGFAAVLAAFLLPDAADGKDYTLTGRNIGCAELGLGRSRQICEAIAASLTWQWMGHAIIAPGYKPSLEGILNVYCALKIGKSDVGPCKI